MASSRKVNKKSKVSVIYKGINVEEFFNIFKNFKTLPHTKRHLIYSPTIYLPNKTKATVTKSED